MDLQNIRVFVLCSRYLSFSKVAELTYSSQSSVSKAVAALESEVGGELFWRNSRRIELTALGEAILPHMEALLRQEEEVREFIHHFQSGMITFPIVIGIAQFLTAAPMDGLLLPLMDAIDEIRRLHAGTDVKIAYFEERQLENMLRSNRISIAITAVNNSLLSQSIFPGADFLRLHTDSNYFLYRTETQEDETLADIISSLDCLFTVQDQIAISVSHEFLRKTKRPIRIETCDNWSEVIVRVKNGQGGTILGASTAEIGIRCGLKAISLADYGIISSLVAIWRHETPGLNEEAAILIRNAFAVGAENGRAMK